MFEVEIKDVSGTFQFKPEISKVERETVLLLSTPNYEAVLQRHQHLQNITMNDVDKNQNYEFI